MDATIIIRREQDLYDLWMRAASPGLALSAVTGERVVVIAPGRRNDGAGPDFLGAVLLIDGRMVCGAVEMHLRESDWFAHGHQHDPAYDGVILHLLAELPSAPALPIPTLAADALRGAMAVASAIDPVNPAAVDDPHALITDLAWARFLRRGIEILRAEPDRPSGDRIGRALLRRLFDALGYAANRRAMGEMIELLLADASLPACRTFEDIAARVLAASGLPRERLAAAGSHLIPASRLDALLARGAPSRHAPEWRRDTRPANAPERRVWGAAHLLAAILCEGLFERLLEALRRRSFDGAVAAVMAAAGGFVGKGRGREIIVNALLPVGLAHGVVAGDGPLVEGSCILYRDAPSLDRNRLVRAVESRYLRGAALRGGFHQQGAVEFYQRYLSPDKRTLSFIAEDASSRSVDGQTDGPFSRRYHSQS